MHVHAEGRIEYELEWVESGGRETGHEFLGSSRLSQRSSDLKKGEGLREEDRERGYIERTVSMTLRSLTWAIGTTQGRNFL